jgi:hypothetical protein
MLAVVEAFVSKVWKTPEIKLSWPEPPTLLEVRIFSGGILRIAKNVPVPFLMTCQELFVYLGLYFCRTLKIKLSVLRSDGELGKELAARDGNLPVRDLVRGLKWPTFLVEGPAGPLVSSRSETSSQRPSGLDGFLELEQFPFGEQLEQLWQLSRARGEPFQGLQQLARALHDGYLPACPESFFQNSRV